MGMMMLSFLGWIPVLGPILQGLFGFAGKFLGTKVAIHQTDATRDVEEARVSAQIIHDTNNDITIRLLRDCVLFFPVVWSMLIGWDTIIAKTSWKVYMWHVADYPPDVAYIPYAAMVFLLGNIGINMWNRK